LKFAERPWGFLTPHVDVTDPTVVSEALGGIDSIAVLAATQIPRF